MTDIDKSPVLHDPGILAELYRVSDPSVIARIAAMSSTIVETLVEARVKIDQVFGARERPRLSSEFDPDIKGLEVIVVGIPGTTDVAADVRRLNEFDRQWWLDASVHETAEVCITLHP